MGWVTLTLRKTELKRTHADYQSQLLGISRRKRQMARQYHYQQTLVQNDTNAELRELRSSYQSASEAARQDMNDARNTQVTNVDGSTGYDQLAYDTAYETYLREKEQYEVAVNDSKQIWEDQLAMIEEEANDMEVMLDQEQVQIEAQLEVISAEIDAVDQAISSQIKASTIKLS